jgi:hypothetical protein
MKQNSVSRGMDALLASFTPEVQQLALATSDYLSKLFPGIVVQVDAKARCIGYGYGPKYVDMVCAILPTKAGVTLGIAYATELPDPGRILEGAGKVHRHVKLKKKSDLKNAALRSLLKSSNAAAISRREN